MPGAGKSTAGRHLAAALHLPFVDCDVEIERRIGMSNNRRALHDHSTVVYLRALPEELFRRLRHDKQRPLLQVADPLKRLRDLFQDRDPLYTQTAHFIIETGRPSITNLVNMVLMQLELAGVVDPQRASAAKPAA
jgi:shikimate kinase